MTLEGIDISNYELGINVATLPGDFVIIKATGGAKFISKAFNWQLQEALGANKCVGIYHFARDGGVQTSAEEEALWFLDKCKSYRGLVVPILDWEGNNAQDTVWAKAWLEMVTTEWGVKPWIYMNLNTEKSHDWSAVVRGDYALWLAEYPPEGRAAGHSATKHWRNPLAWQYTDKGIVQGWNAFVDLDIFYGNRETWAQYVQLSS